MTDKLHYKQVNEMDVNFGELKVNLSAVNSAMRVNAIATEMARSERVAAAIARESAKRDATLIAGAEASIEQRDLIEKQLGVLCEQNLLLLDNYEKLKEMYDAQVQENKDAKDELKRSRRYNGWMMAVSVISMLAAIASTVIPFLCERLK